MFTYRVEQVDGETVYTIENEEGLSATVTQRERAREMTKLLNRGASMKEIVDYGIGVARDFALAAHGDQDHGSLKISKHLEMVAALVDLYCDYPLESYERMTVVAAAWCHDILEDTSVTPEELSREISNDVSFLVEAVTDAAGENRYERHLNTYWGIREAGSDAVLVKLADRVHNHSRSLEYKEHYLEMYIEEYPYFKMALWRPREHAKLWECLDNQYEAMKDAAKEKLREGK